MARPRRRLFLESRYRKLVRGLPQTVFFCPVCKGHPRRRNDCARCEGRGKLTDDSVQELLARRLLPAFRAREGRFHGAGREDIDVRMLGRGRPFVFEIVDPRREDVDLEALLERFHATEGERVQVDPFRPVDRKRVGELKESRWAKLYRIGARFEGPFDRARLAALVDREIEVTQRTPQRVAHRRADLERTRRIRVMVLRDVPDADLELDVETEHGTYVKEWVSGDGGRSTPSLAELAGTVASCLRLDVLEVLTGAGDALPTGARAGVSPPGPARG